MFPEVVWTPEALFVCSAVLSSLTSVCMDIVSNEKKTLWQILAAGGLYGLVGAAFAGVVGEYISKKPMTIFACSILVGARAITINTIGALASRVLDFRVTDKDDEHQARKRRQNHEPSSPTPDGPPSGTRTGGDTGGDKPDAAPK